MTPLLAELRIRTYSARYGVYDDSRLLNERIKGIDSELRGVSPLSRKFKELSQTRFDLKSYAESLDSLKQASTTQQ